MSGVRYLRLSYLAALVKEALTLCSHLQCLTIQIDRLIREISMREVQASEAKARLASLLDAVERGETIVITRHGKPIARIVPESDLRQAEIEEFRRTIPRIPLEEIPEIDRVAAEIEEFRRTMPRIPLEEILSARHEGHKY
jgi:prevent-host-death family protein